MKLLPTPIPDWRSAWRFWSVRVAAAAVAWAAVPLETQAKILGALGVEPSRVPAIIGLLVIVTRLIAQRTAAAEQPDV